MAILSVAPGVPDPITSRPVVRRGSFSSCSAEAPQQSGNTERQSESTGYALIVMQPTSAVVRLNETLNGQVVSAVNEALHSRRPL